MTFPSCWIYPFKICLKIIHLNSSFYALATNLFSNPLAWVPLEVLFTKQKYGIRKAHQINIKKKIKKRIYALNGWCNLENHNTEFGKHWTDCWQMATVIWCEGLKKKKDGKQNKSWGRKIRKRNTVNIMTE